MRKNLSTAIFFVIILTAGVGIAYVIENYGSSPERTPRETTPPRGTTPPTATPPTQPPQGGSIEPPAPPPPVPTSNLTYTYDAKFEPPTGRIVHGMGQWINYNTQYVALFSESYKPASELIFIDIGDTPRGWEPVKIKGALVKMGAEGRIPSIDIGLRGLKFSKAELDAMADPLFGIDDELVAGSSKYEARVNDVITIVKEFKKPVMVRIGGEFSGWWNGYHPYEYPKAFRKIVNMFRSAGVENVAFIWCYEPAAANDFDEKNAAGEYKWFPGNDVVDWYGIDLFANKDISGSSQTAAGVLTNYGKTLRFLDFAKVNNKPVYLAETSPSDVKITTSVEDGKTDWEAWFKPYFALMSAHPQIKWFHYINYDWGKTNSGEIQGWQNADISINSYISSQFVAEMKKPGYLHLPEKYLLKDYTLYN